MLRLPIAARDLAGVCKRATFGNVFRLFFSLNGRKCHSPLEVSLMSCSTHTPGLLRACSGVHSLNTDPVFPEASRKGRYPRKLPRPGAQKSPVNGLVVQRELERSLHTRLNLCGRIFPLGEQRARDACSCLVRRGIPAHPAETVPGGMGVRVRPFSSSSVAMFVCFGPS